ncbi:MAG TPA: hypothetical protein VJT75_02945 [Thermoleophilaceae bacterium]|nr:hypothetical protein [Thermoleophilaceae bacterium]
MALLTALITHQSAEQVARQLAYLESLAPGSAVFVCYGGERAEFDRLDGDRALFVDDPWWQTSNREQSYVGLLGALHERAVRDDPSIDLVLLLEYDQLVLSGDFEARLADVAERSGAGLVGKWAGPRNDTNWPHHIRFRDDARFNGYVERITRRDDAGARLGCLGAGMLIRRDALTAYCEAAEEPHVYGELHVPTVIWHLGFEVADFDAHGDLYGAVRWRPEYAVAEAIAHKRAGGAFVHPFKALDHLDWVRSA